jgi:hypothetical protein
MKQITAIFLLITLSLTSVQATWVFHYCSGQLHAVGIAGSQAGMACCDDTDTDAGRHASSDLPHAVSLPEVPCCSNYLLEIFTADRCVDRSATSVEATNHLAMPALFAHGLTSLLREVEIGCRQYTFPPGSFAKYYVDLLIFICIFRI